MNEDYEDYYEGYYASRAWEDCSCDENYTCAKCFAKW